MGEAAERGGGGAPAGAILVSPKQRGNPILGHIKHVLWTEAPGIAPDPALLVFLKAQRNSVPVPRHWSAKRKYLSAMHESCPPFDRAHCGALVAGRIFARPCPRSIQRAAVEEERRAKKKAGHCCPADAPIRSGVSRGERRRTKRTNAGREGAWLKSSAALIIAMRVAGRNRWIRMGAMRLTHEAFRSLHRLP